MPTLITAAATAVAPAGGAALGEIAAATAGATVLTLLLLALGAAHRSGRISVLRRAGDVLARRAGIASWAALPTELATVSLLIAAFGMYWDISLHIDNGRDPGPLANPAHYFILAGLFGIFAAGYLAVVLPEGRPSRTSIRIREGWYAPLGGVVLLATSAFALFAFPLDDVWHRLFGQDVTLWGPTHLMMIGGAGLSLLGNTILVVEGHAAHERDGGSQPTGFLALVARQRAYGLCGGLLVGLSTFQAEFDFGVPQFRMYFQPVLIAFAAGLALTAARTLIGRGGALGTALYFLIIRGLLTLLVGPVLGQTTPHLPLYLAEALAVEGVALLVGTDRRIRFGALAGLAAAAAGFPAEYAWSHVWMPIAWPARIVGEALVPSLAAGLGAGLIGAFLGTALVRGRGGATAAVASTAGAARPASRTATARVRPWAAAAGVATMIVLIAVGLDTTPQRGVHASIALHTVTGGPKRTVSATVRITPASAAHDADWLNATAWQGHGFVLDRLRRTGDGTYVTTKPLPVYGSWKTMLRLQKRDSLISVPLYLPNDPAIPAVGVPATAHIERDFVNDRSVLQRERKKGVPPALPLIGYAIVGAITLTLIAILGWAFTRLAAGGDGSALVRRRRRSKLSTVLEGGPA